MVATTAPARVVRAIEFFGRLSEKTFAQIVDAAWKHEGVPVLIVSMNTSAMEEFLEDLGRRKTEAAELLTVPEPIVQISNFLALKSRPAQPFLVAADPSLHYTTLRLTFDKAAQ